VNGWRCRMAPEANKVILSEIPLTRNIVSSLETLLIYNSTD